MEQRKKILLLILVMTGLVLNGCGSANPNSKLPENNSTKAPNKPVDNTTPKKAGNFVSNLPAGFELPSDDVGKKLLREYGAVFVAKGGTVPPDKIIFKDAGEVSTWQAKTVVVKETIGGVEIELQAPAMKALKEAVDEARSGKLTITPRGTDAARRDYQDTEELWASRVGPGLEYWAGKGKLSREEAKRIKALSPFEQVPEIFRLESEGMYFSKDLAKSIIYSVAPPGASQHLSLLALDVTENENPKVREILAQHGWFQTVVSDLPHFTYLGVTEKELTGLGLSKTSQGGRDFWIPDCK